MNKQERSQELFRKLLELAESIPKTEDDEDEEEE